MAPERVCHLVAPQGELYYLDSSFFWGGDSPP